MTETTRHTCTDCNQYAPRAAHVSIMGFQSQHPGWEAVSEHGMEKLRKQYAFDVFDAAIAFAEQIIFLARAEGHHPTIRLERNTMCVIVTWWTKALNGIHNSDLILAAQTDRLFDAEQVKRSPHLSTGHINTPPEYAGNR